ncbi:MAG: hypothetical protein OEW87_06430 [Flavobacteriaceae bacterium]|nr:hypothetical protein [Flavobacteriaceae bacterium]
MDVDTIAIMGIQVLVWAVIVIILIYLVIRRIEIKKREDFEDRDN